MYQSANVFQSCEKIRLALESCEVEKDIANFIQDRGTGQEIPDPPKYINFCRGDINDSASETSEDDSYSVAQFQRTINPAFRSSSPQPSTFESHHDPQSDLAMRMGHVDLNAPQNRDTTTMPQKGAQQPSPQLDYRRQAQNQAQYQQNQQGQQVELATVPHNEYPTDGMTMFCRTDAPPSERSSAHSPVRPSSRDSQSDYSNPTSFSSIEPPSGHVSPTKQLQGTQLPVSPNKQVQKRRSGFFSNSPFRRKSKHEKEAPRSNTWAASNGRNSGSTNPSPTRPGVQSRDFAADRSHSPEPADPRANFQLNIGNNVFDVASPDSHRKPQPSAMQSHMQAELDPIAAALEELKGVTKQSSTRVSADRYHGIATPAPPGSNTPVAAAQRGTPPPSYHSQESVSRLGAPKPAFTSAQMQQTTRKYVNQNQDMYGSGQLSRPGTGGGVPRAASPLPMRSTSPRPGFQGGHAPQGQGNQRYGNSAERSVSPNAYVIGGGSVTMGMQPQPRQAQSQSMSPVKQGYGGYQRHTSPNDIRRAASPQPQYGRQERPVSSAGGSGMAMQLSNGGPGVGQRGRDGSGGRPVSYYGGGNSGVGGGASGNGGGMRGGPDPAARTRSKSVADGRQFTNEGRAILHFGKPIPLQYIPNHSSLPSLVMLDQEDCADNVDLQLVRCTPTKPRSRRNCRSPRGTSLRY